MDNIGKVFSISVDDQLLKDLSICDGEIVGNKGVLLKKYNEYSVLEVDCKFSFCSEVMKREIVILNNRIILE